MKIHTDNDDILWLIIEGPTLNLDDLLICLCNNLPSDSRRQSLMDEDIFNIICSYVTSLKNEYGNDSHILICDDMNARKANRDYFVPFDISTHMDVLLDDYTCDINFPCATQDFGFNANGLIVFNFYKRSGFRIVNGRVGDDSKIGKCTYVGFCGSSLNNDEIANQELFRYFTNFFVNSRNIMSDHCDLNFAVELRMPCYNTHESEMTKDESCSH